MRSVYRIIGYIIKALTRLILGIPSSKPDQVLNVPSREGAARSIKVHVYDSAKHSPQENKKKPVLFNMHGSGFILALHGWDDDYCRLMAQNTEYTVFDIQYRLGPSNLFPAPVEDVEDVVRYVLEHNHVYDIDRLSISGFSAGGTLALVAAGVVFPPKTFQSVLAFYPPTDLYTDPSTKKQSQPGPSPIFPPFMLKVFFTSYLPNQVSGLDPRASPLFADTTNYPNNVVIMTGAYDNLSVEGKSLADKLIESGRTNIVYREFDKANHGFDKFVRPGSYEEACKKESYQIAQKMLKF